MIPYKQLSLADIYAECQDKFENDKPAFLSLLETHIDIDEIIPISAGVNYISLNANHSIKDFFVVCLISFLWFYIGRIVFLYIFKRSRQFKWTY